MLPVNLPYNKIDGITRQLPPNDEGSYKKIIQTFLETNKIAKEEALSAD